MGKSGAHRTCRKDARGTARESGPPDGAVYIGIGMIGLFGLALWYLFSEETWRHGLLGYLIAVAVLVNLFALRAYLGHRLAGWQRSLARLPLRFAGYGARGGRPLTAARHARPAGIMVMLSIVTSVTLLAVVGWVLLVGPAG